MQQGLHKMLQIRGYKVNNKQRLKIHVDYIQLIKLFINLHENSFINESNSKIRIMGFHYSIPTLQFESCGQKGAWMNSI